MHKSLLRQLKRCTGLADPDSFGAVIEEAAQLSSQSGLSPALSGLLGSLGDLLERIDASYEQSDRDLALRTRSLEVSSAELSALNEQMRQELGSRERSIDSLRNAIARLLPDLSSGLTGQDSSDLEVLSGLVANLVHQNEESRRELTNQKFALDQHAIVSITDTQGYILYANDRFCEISGYARGELFGRNHSIVNSGFHEPAFFADMWATIQSGKVWHGEIKNRNKSGAEYWVSATIVPFLDEYGLPLQYIAIRTDITARKEAETALQVAKEHAEAASRAKSEFLANMSHEIRTPMNGIIGMTDLTLDTQLDDEQREFLNIVKSSADALLTIINDILDFSKIEAGRMDIEEIPFDIHKLLAETLKTLSLRAHEKGLELLCDTHPSVPRHVLGDPGRIRQILINLIGNAIKFTHVGEILLSVEVQEYQSLPEGDTLLVHLAVKDTGIGIPQQKQKLIFEAFSQEDSSITRQYGGTGLGLTISNQLVGLMGGHMWVESQLGAGSTFHFAVRLKLDQSNATIEQFDVKDLNGRSVLIVDDHPTNREILSRQLAKWGIQAEAVSSGGAALKRLYTAERPFDCLLLDAQMPDMDGYVLAKTLRESPPIYGVPPMLMLSSGGTRGDAQQCRDLGIAAYFPKPVAEDELHAGLRRVLLQVESPVTVPSPPLVTRHLLREESRTLRVLLVEDHPVNQKLALGLLNRWGHEVVVADDGQAGVDAFERGEFDVILMDVQLPVMSGIEATQRIRQLEAARKLAPMPIIAMTANAMQGDREACLEAGMDDYIAKPIKAKELQEMLLRIPQRNIQAP